MSDVAQTGPRALAADAALPRLPCAWAGRLGWVVGSRRLQEEDSGRWKSAGVPGMPNAEEAPMQVGRAAMEPEEPCPASLIAELELELAINKCEMESDAG